MQSFSDYTLFSRRALAVLISTCLLAQGCASFRGPAYQLEQADETTFSKPLRSPKSRQDENSEILVEGQSRNQQDGMVVERPPKMSFSEAAERTDEQVLPALSDEKIRKQSYNNLPIPAFINEVFGNQLGLNFIIQPGLRSAPDLITLRLETLMSQKELYLLATRTLAQYGVTTLLQDGVLVFDYSAEASEQTPILNTGDALPEVPSGNRPIFYVYPVSTVGLSQVKALMKQLFPNKGLEVSEDIMGNNLLLKGKHSTIRDAVAALKLLDRPSLTGMESIILKPSLNSVEDLSSSLKQILETEGYMAREGTGNAPIRLLPLNTTGQLIVFAKSQAVLDYVVEWAQKLEAKRQEDVEDGLFSYQVQSTQATHIVQLLSTLGVAQGYTSSSSQSGNDQSESKPTPRPASPSSNSSGSRFAVDEQLNTILFSGSGKAWAKSLKMIRKLDKPAPSVMVEVILAEVTLDESESSAIEWLFNSSVGDYLLRGSTGGLAGSEGGLNLTLNSGASTRATLNFLYSNSRTKIRSRPRVMVKSGQEASIEVGDRVPTVTSQIQNSVTQSDSYLTQVSYQETGVLLDIKPTVHATGFVDIEISQELSEASPNDISAIDSPTISTRSLKTTLTLRDGGAVLIGGLIRAKDVDGEKGVPVLGKLPLLGKLFRGDSLQNNRTELMMMVIPYILSTPDEVETLSDEMQLERLELIESY